MSPEEKLRLAHILLKAAMVIEPYLRSISKEAFLNVTLCQDAVIRRIQIIGEAVRHLSHDLLRRIPDFPAKEARGMRNVPVHHYHQVNPEHLWDTAGTRYSALRMAVEKYLQLNT